MLVVRSSRPDRDWAVDPRWPVALSCREGSLAAVGRSRDAHAAGPVTSADGADAGRHQDAQRAGSDDDLDVTRSARVAVDLDGLGRRRLQPRGGAPEAQACASPHRRRSRSGTGGRRARVRPSTTPVAATTNRSSWPSSGRAGSRGRITPGTRSPTLVTMAMDASSSYSTPSTVMRYRAGLMSRPAGSPGTGTRPGRTGPCCSLGVVAMRRASKPMPQPMALIVRRGGAPGARSVVYSDTSAEVDGAWLGGRERSRWRPCKPGRDAQDAAQDVARAARQDAQGNVRAREHRRDRSLGAVATQPDHRRHAPAQGRSGHDRPRHRRPPG